MLYVVQKNIFQESNYNKIFEALERLGLEYIIVDYVNHRFAINTKRTDVFPFGSVRLARISAQRLWTPGSFYGGNHDFEIYSQFYKDNLLNYDSELIKLYDTIEWGHNEIKFIRPAKDSKVFTGKLYSKTKWDDYITSEKELGTINPNLIIQVSKPKKIYKEARIWIVDGKVITSSYYKFGDNVIWEENVEPEGLEFAQRMTDLYQVAEAFVMDICLTPDGWKIVEINCINCSGFYQGDLQKILIALEDKYNPL